MRVAYEPSASNTVLQKATTSFTGIYPDRATIDLGTDVRLIAARAGTDMNGYVVTTDVDGRVHVYNAAGEQVSYGIVPGATWEAFVTYINRHAVLAPLMRASLLVAGAMSANSVTFVGGVDPTIDAGKSRFRVENTDGGLFYFDQDRALILEQVEGKFPGGVGVTATVELINLDEGLQPLTDESSTLFSVALPASEDIFVGDIKVMLQKLQAVRVTCAFAGKVWLTFRQASATPRG